MPDRILFVDEVEELLFSLLRRSFESSTPRSTMSLTTSVITSVSTIVPLEASLLLVGVGGGVTSSPPIPNPSLEI